MIKRIAVAAILFSMVLHGAGRTGILSYLYQQRHHIACAIGTIAEIPIALCSSDYHAGNTFTLHSSENNQALPAVFAAIEIVLFLHPDPPMPAGIQYALLREVTYLPYEEGFPADPLQDFFQPPRV